VLALAAKGTVKQLAVVALAVSLVTHRLIPSVCLPGTAM
jgi:hypothetical protein